MGKLRLDINSTDVFGVYGIVDIVFNGATLASSKQLSATVESLEYDVDILTSGDNILQISLLNDQAYDANNDGNYNGPEDKTLQAKVSSLSYAVDGVSFITLLPQIGTAYTVSTGEHAGKTWDLNFEIPEFVSYGLDYILKFDTNEGLLNTPSLQAYSIRLIDGVYIDSEGRVCPS